MSLNIPNLLTLFRIIAIPLIVIVYFSNVKYLNWYCWGLFALAGVSDALDGYLARKWNQTSQLGAFLDPVADKLLVAIMLLLVATNTDVKQAMHSEFWFTVTVMVIIGREITVSALREWMAELGKRANVAVSVVGKYKTGIQMVAIACLIFEQSSLPRLGSRVRISFPAPSHSRILQQAAIGDKVTRAEGSKLRAFK